MSCGCDQRREKIVRTAKRFVRKAFGLPPSIEEILSYPFTGEPEGYDDGGRTP